MVTTQTDVEDCEGKEKFSFTSITRKFKFSKRTDKKSPRRKFKFSNFFRRKKPAEAHFDSGFGESVDGDIQNKFP